VWPNIDTRLSPRLPYSLQPIRSHRFTLANAVEGTRFGGSCQYLCALVFSGEDAFGVRAKFRNCGIRFGELAILNFDQTPNAWLASERYSPPVHPEPVAVFVLRSSEPERQPSPQAVGECGRDENLEKGARCKS
jgi:hypothetical protein